MDIISYETFFPCFIGLVSFEFVFAEYEILKRNMVLQRIYFYRQ